MAPPPSPRSGDASARARPSSTSPPHPAPPGGPPPRDSRARARDAGADRVDGTGSSVAALALLSLAGAPPPRPPAPPAGAGAWSRLSTAAGAASPASHSPAGVRDASGRGRRDDLSRGGGRRGGGGRRDGGGRRGGRGRGRGCGRGRGLGRGRGRDGGRVGERGGPRAGARGGRPGGRPCDRPGGPSGGRPGAAPPRDAAVPGGGGATVWDAFAIADEANSPAPCPEALASLFPSPPRLPRETALTGDDGCVLFPTPHLRAPAPPPPSREDAVEAYERDLPRKLLRSRRGPPPGQEECVRATLRDVFGISEPRRYQIAAVFRLVYCKPAFMYLIHKTGEGKSLVMLAMAFMLRQVTVVLGPLHGLAADQVCKSKRLDKGVEAWHADEFRGPFHARLAHRMMNVRSEDVVLLFISPQALQDREEGSKYYRVLERLAMKGQISSFCVDECQRTDQSEAAMREAGEVRGGAAVVTGRGPPTVIRIKHKIT